MNRLSQAPPKPSAQAAKAAAPAFKQQQQQQQQHPGRIPLEFKEAMLHIPVKPAQHTTKRTFAMAAHSKPAQRRSAKPSDDKWKSSFQLLGDENDAVDEINDSSQRAEIYDPYDPFSSDSEHEMLQAQNRNQSPPDNDNQLERQRLSPGQDCQKKRRFASTFIESVGINMQDLIPETGPSESRDLNPDHRLPDHRQPDHRQPDHRQPDHRQPDHRLPDHRLPDHRQSDHRQPERQAYSPSTESHDNLGYDSMSRHQDHGVGSPDRLIHDSSTQHFPPSYGEQRTNGEERNIIPEYMSEMTKVRLSPPRLQRDYPLPSESRGTGSTGLDHIPPSSDVPRIRKLRMIMDTIPCDISCDLCDVEFINGLELEDHLESNSHWATMEFIQQQNNYDDMTIAFIQEVMLHKSHQCDRAMESSALQALQENDHMTKIEMFHCAACSVFLSTAASSVQAHITSQEHLVNTKDCQVEQRLSCLDKAGTIMKKLKHQFEHFLEGGSPFE
ncbi:hypothetical protein PBY51_020993 [Eleginops maclovinus]|uniref:DBIRD complex subunit ZNF326 n=1 Tax=Eleginops maclovinus TaxID=56733 RepID=A0AAN8AGV8_ELEMC|nr:hypothetical protein PBY51_020993 [Eleginops maclovinus]